MLMPLLWGSRKLTVNSKAKELSDRWISSKIHQKRNHKSLKSSWSDLQCLKSPLIICYTHQKSNSGMDTWDISSEASSQTKWHSKKITKRIFQPWAMARSVPSHVRSGCEPSTFSARWKWNRLSCAASNQLHAYCMGTETIRQGLVTQRADCYVIEMQGENLPQDAITEEQM